MEADEDGIVLVILDDEGDEARKVSEGSELVPFTIKQEPEDSTSLVQEMLETAERHGEHIKIENLPFITDIIKEEPFHYEYLEVADFSECEQDDTNYSNSGRALEDSDFSDQDDVSIEKFIYNDDKARRKMLDPIDRRSYVDELRRDHPELSTNHTSLVQLVADVMKSVTAPMPPPNIFKFKNFKYQCKACSRVMTTERSATRHYHESHGPRYLCCFACGADFRSQASLYKHEKRCVAPDASVVRRARSLAVDRKTPNRVYTKKTRTIQKQKQANTSSFECTECTATFRSKLGLTAHVHLHRGERPHVCDACPAAYTTRSALVRHRELHTGKKYVCDHCQKEFRQKSALQYHMDTHLPQRKYPCPVAGCSRRFAQKNALNIHINGTHNNLPPPCACEICPRRFPRMSVLKVHMKKEHGMILMTRNMFFKSLPKMTEAELQKAKLIFNNNTDKAAILPATDTKQNPPEHILPDAKSDKDATNVNTSKPRFELIGDKPEDHELLYLKNILSESGELSKGSILVVEDGVVKSISKKSKSRKHYEKLIKEAGSNVSVVSVTSGDNMPLT